MKDLVYLGETMLQLYKRVTTGPGLALLLVHCIVVAQSQRQVQRGHRSHV